MVTIPSKGAWIVLINLYVIVISINCVDVVKNDRFLMSKTLKKLIILIRFHKKFVNFLPIYSKVLFALDPIQLLLMKFNSMINMRTKT